MQWEQATSGNRFRCRPYGRKWIVYDGKTGRIAEFLDSKGRAVVLAAVLNGQMSNPAAWRAMEEDIING